ncbi:hypothetical protein [Acinetobacter chinensis]|jgi:hypothetical protein|uniref:hypothetical protein n=1 Tax=Acinetobacter chinensis TaxID=2004650 RepID=UPI0029348485|nr:hypothetical protein [Acinetobacter chinensis]WOE42392.1 hypothetical protein QSG87_04420 [Acinetobacter chinensis]
MKEFFINNLFGIVTFILGLAVTIVIYVLQTRKANSALIEREKQVKKEIIDTIENYIINDKDVDEASFLNLKSGIERTNNLILDKDWNWMSLLQDISSRLQTSRHLATDQKLEYAKKLDTLIESWKTQQELNKSIQSDDEDKIINDILDKLKEQNSDSKNEVIKSIYKLVDLKKLDSINKQIDIEKKVTVFTRLITSSSVGLIASLGAIFITNGLSEKYFDNKAKFSIASDSTIVEKHAPSDGYTLLIFIGIIFTIFVILIINRLIQRKQNKFRVEINPIYSENRKK